MANTIQILIDIDMAIYGRVLEDTQLVIDRIKNFK